MTHQKLSRDASQNPGASVPTPCSCHVIYISLYHFTYTTSPTTILLSTSQFHSTTPYTLHHSIPLHNSITPIYLFTYPPPPHNISNNEDPRVTNRSPCTLTRACSWRWSRPSTYLLSCRGEFSWPSLGKTSGRPWGILMAACGEFLMAIDNGARRPSRRTPHGVWYAPSRYNPWRTTSCGPHPHGCLHGSVRSTRLSCQQRYRPPWSERSTPLRAQCLVFSRLLIQGYHKVPEHRP